MPATPTNSVEWTRILRSDLVSHAFSAVSEFWPGAAVFTAPNEDYFNLAVLLPDPPSDPEALLEGIIAHYRALNITPRVRVTPISQPNDWPQHLQRRGFVETAEVELFMRLDGPLRLPANPAVGIRRAPSEAPLEVFVTVQSEGFGSHDPPEGWVSHVGDNLTLWDYQFYLADLDGQPAGAATARYEGGVVGIYGVTTIERFRRRGVSTTLLHAIVDDAQRGACDLVFLSAEPDGYARHLYQRLGFIDLFSIRTFELPENR